MPPWQSPARPCRQRLIAQSSRICSSASSTRQRRATATRLPAQPGAHRHRRREVEMLGRLTWAAIPFNEPLPLISAAVVAIAVLAILVTITVKGWLPYLWREWVTSVDHKRIGVMYFALGLIMLLRGFSDAIMMRTQQAIAVGTAQGYLPPDHYNQIFSAHGAIMI